MASPSALIGSDAPAAAAYRSYKQRFAILGLYALSNMTNAFLVSLNSMKSGYKLPGELRCLNRKTAASTRFLWNE